METNDQKKKFSLRRLWAAITQPFRVIFGFTNNRLNNFSSWVENLGFYKFIKIFEVLAILIAIVAFFIELQDRRADRHNRAWSLIASATGSPDVGNIGVGNALEILNNDGVSLANIQLPGAWLDNVNLLNAFLEKAELKNADLFRANLGGADLFEAILSGANLTRANLSEANLSGAYLTRANLSGAKNLEQKQVDSTCYLENFEPPKPPDGLKPPPVCSY